MVHHRLVAYRPAKNSNAIITLCLIIHAAVNMESIDFAGNFSSTIIFSDSSNPLQCVTINLHGDDIFEGERSFLVIFSSTNQRDVIMSDTTLVTIVDDDGIYKQGGIQLWKYIYLLCGDIITGRGIHNTQ